MNIRRLSAFGAAFLIAISATAAQAPAAPEKKLSCEGRNQGDRKRACEMKEITLAGSGRLNVDAGPNGSITIQGWSRGDVLVRARIDAWGENESEAKATMGQVRVEAAGSQVRSTGPKEWMQQKWSVSYEVFVPQKSDLTLETTNGGINIADVRGAIAAETTNGGLRLARLAGTVKAETTNGGVNIELTGRTWDGESLHVETTNGGVNLEVPSAYAARIEAKTTNGGLNSDLPAQVTGKSWGSKSMVVNSGSGGPLIHIETTNGGVRVKQKNAA
jgi:hypothetical protein